MEGNIFNFFFNSRKQIRFGMCRSVLECIVTTEEI